MEVQFINKDVAGESFERGRQAHETTRRQEESDFEARRQRDQAAGVDKAIREGIGAIYAKPATSAPAPTTTPVQAEPPPVTAQAPASAQAPATTPMPAVFPPNASETGSALPQAAARPVSTPTPPQPAAAAPAPAPAAPPAPTAAINSVTPRPAPAARPQPGGDDLITRLAKTPGAGNAAMTLHGSNVTAQAKAHEESRADRDKGTELFIKAFEAGQPDVARTIATQYQLNVPDQLFNSKSFTSEMTRIANVVGKLTGEDAANFTHEALRLMPKEPETFDQTGMRYQQALTKITGKKKIVETAGGIMQVPESGDEPGAYIKQPGTNKPAMPAPKTMVHVNTGDQDKPTAEMKNAAWLKKVGVAKTDQEAWDMLHTAKTDPMAKQKLARNLMSSAKDRAGRPIYSTLDAAMKALDDNTAGAGATPPAAPAGEPAPAAAPKASKGAQALPMTAEGRPDAGKLVDGQQYSFKTKAGKDVTGTWDAASKKFK